MMLQFLLSGTNVQFFLIFVLKCVELQRFNMMNKKKNLGDLGNVLKFRLWMLMAGKHLLL